MPQPGPQSVDDPMYREQPQMARNDWPQAQQAPIRQSNSVWPEKLVKQTAGDDKASPKKGQKKDSDYSEEYNEGDENQGDDATTTEAPKKVRISIFINLK